MPIAFIAFDPSRNSYEFNKLSDLDYNNLTGNKVWDYVNPITHPDDKEQLLDFIIERKIPTKPSKYVESAFYMGKIEIKCNFECNFIKINVFSHDS